MISCDKCGFGHLTFEEKDACKSWDQMVKEWRDIRFERPLDDCAAVVPPYWDTLRECTSETCHRPLPCSVHKA